VVLQVPAKEILIDQLLAAVGGPSRWHGYEQRTEQDDGEDEGADVGGALRHSASL
jgi:hypothetical protein